MIRSMTGFGKSECELADKKLTIELRSLNSRQMDLSFKIPAMYREKETILRNDIASRLKRGKADLVIYSDGKGAANIAVINTATVMHYAGQLIKTGQELGLGEYDPMEIMKMAIRMPDTLINEKQEADEDEWELVYGSFQAALDELDSFRIQEGAAMKAELENRIYEIEENLSGIEKFEANRIDNVRKRLQQNLQDFINSNNVDRNRFEQEIIYYLEKLDISEEKVRLVNHIAYFRETLGEAETVGKKLGFISQEIGREINTIGSKANDFNIQKLVVQMKDELEKIKELSLNIL
jgi:uncharacterized protein (TIGR00255 family)